MGSEPRRHEFGAVVATERFTFEAKDGSRVDGAIRIGTPFRRGPHEWGCPVAIDGLHAGPLEARSTCSVQALSLALQLVRQLLGHHIEDGGRILDPESGEVWGQAGLDALLGARPSFRSAAPPR